MKYISWILTLPLAIVAVVFAISNREGVSLNIWPLGMTVEAPLFILVLGSALAGLITGGFIAWLSAGTTRQRRRAAVQRAEAAERELAFLRQKIESESRAPTAPRGAASGAPANGAPLGAANGPTRLPAARA